MQCRTQDLIVLGVGAAALDPGAAVPDAGAVALGDRLAVLDLGLQDWTWGPQYRVSGLQCRGSGLGHPPWVCGAERRHHARGPAFAGLFVLQQRLCVRRDPTPGEGRRRPPRSEGGGHRHRQAGRREGKGREATAATPTPAARRLGPRPRPDGRRRACARCWAAAGEQGGRAGSGRPGLPVSWGFGFRLPGSGFRQGTGGRQAGAARAAAEQGHGEAAAGPERPGRRGAGPHRAGSGPGGAGRGRSCAGRVAEGRLRRLPGRLWGASPVFVASAEARFETHPTPRFWPSDPREPLCCPSSRPRLSQPLSAQLRWVCCARPGP